MAGRGEQQGGGSRSVGPDLVAKGYGPDELVSEAFSNGVSVMRRVEDRMVPGILT